jgi:hypothetical protein
LLYFWVVNGFEGAQIIVISKAFAREPLAVILRTRIYTIRFIQQIYPFENKLIADTVNSFKQRHEKNLIIWSEGNTVLSKFFQITAFQLKTQNKAA